MGGKHGWRRITSLKPMNENKNKDFFPGERREVEQNSMEILTRYACAKDKKTQDKMDLGHIITQKIVKCSQKKLVDIKISSHRFSQIWRIVDARILLCAYQMMKILTNSMEFQPLLFFFNTLVFIVLFFALLLQLLSE